MNSISDMTGRYLYSSGPERERGVGVGASVCVFHFWFGVGEGWGFVSKVTLCEIPEKQYSFKLSGMCWREEDHSRKKRIVGCGVDSHLQFCVL